MAWNATEFFKNLTAKNLLAAEQGFVFCRVSSLEGFEEALAQMQSAKAVVAVSDTSEGYMEMNNTPRTRQVKTVFVAMRHPLDDMEARQECFATMRELFRQFMSVLILEKTKLEQSQIYLDPRIAFNEIDRYFFNGAACAFFQIAVDTFTDLRYSEDEWKKPVYDLWLLTCRNSDLWMVAKQVTMYFGGDRQTNAEKLQNLPLLLVEDYYGNTMETMWEETLLRAKGIGDIELRARE